MKHETTETLSLLNKNKAVLKEAQQIMDKLLPDIQKGIRTFVKDFETIQFYYSVADINNNRMGMLAQSIQTFKTKYYDYANN